MADIVKYTPTKNMTSSDRTLDGYYACIKAWVQEIYDDVFSKWFTVEYSDDNPTVTENDDGSTTSTHDYTITFTSIIEGCTAPLYFDLATSGTLKMYTSGTSHYDYSSCYNFDLSSNASISIYNADYFFIGAGGSPKLIYGFMRAKCFDGTDKWVNVNCIRTSSSNSYKYLNFFESDVRYASLQNVSVNLYGKSEYYVVRNMIPYADAIMTDMFYLDGGLTNSVPNGIFKIGDNKYCTINQEQSPSNIVVKL